jgi:mono/diheme cytochrome c family protein
MSRFPFIRIVGPLLALVLVSPVQAQDDGKQLFNSVTPACAVCHTLKDAGAAGQIGPSLDELKPDAARVARAVKLGIGQMPAFTQLTEDQIRTIAQYVEKATR